MAPRPLLQEEALCVLMLSHNCHPWLSFPVPLILPVLVMRSPHACDLVTQCPGLAESRSRDGAARLLCLGGPCQAPSWDVPEVTARMEGTSSGSVLGATCLSLRQRTVSSVWPCICSEPQITHLPVYGSFLLDEVCR